MKTFITCLLILIAYTSAFAQTEDNVLMPEDMEYRFGIGFVPQYAIVSGMRLDFDFKVARNQYLTLAPQLYYNKNYTMWYPDETDMKGVGANLNYRYLFTRKESPDGPYLGFGLVYKYFDVSYFGDVWYDYIENGNVVQRQEFDEINREFNQGGYDLLIGYEGTYERFFFDVYVGWGFRLSDFDDSDTEDDFWGETIFDPGYSGFLPTIGFRAGLFIK